MRSYSPWKIYGGKGNIARWILSHVEQRHVRTWIEPFLGGAHVYCALDHGREFRPLDVLLAEADPVLRRVHSLAAERDFRSILNPVFDAIDTANHMLVGPGYFVGDEKRVWNNLRDYYRDYDSVAHLWIHCRHGFGGYQAAKKTGTIHPKWGTWMEADQQGLSSLAWYLYAMTNEPVRPICADCMDPLGQISSNSTHQPIVAYLDPPYSGDTRSSSGGKYHGEETQRWDAARVIEVATAYISQVVGDHHGRVMISHYPQSQISAAIQAAARSVGATVDIWTRRTTTIGGSPAEVLWDVHHDDDPTTVRPEPETDEPRSRSLWEEGER